MRKAKKLYVLLGVLLVICAATFAVSRYQEQKENIKNSGEVILEIPTDSVTALSWTNESGTFSFTKDGETWVYDADSAFPVSEDKISELLSQFEDFSAAFVIDDVDDYSQYGLDDPVCTITITAEEKKYTVELGDFSKMDQQRYVSIGDGKAYLVENDPLDEFSAVLSDMIQNDTVPDFDIASEISFSGDENYSIVRDEDGKSICEDDVYFAGGKPLDTEKVDVFLNAVSSLSLDSYATYNVSAEELAAFGLDDPELTIDLTYGKDDDEGTLKLSLSRDPEEAAAYDEAVEKDAEELPDVACYVRVGQSQIVYKISQDVYEQLTAVSYNELRHKKLFTADFDSVTSVDFTLNGENYTFTYTPSRNEDEDGIWKYNKQEIDASDLKTAISSLLASDFTDKTPTGQEEISMTVHLDNENFSTFTLTLYRYDGSDCIAVIDGEPVALVPRNRTVDLIEAVNELTLGN